jgi:hypothetical protein
MLRRLLFALVVVVVAVVAVGAGWWIWGRDGTHAAERPDIPFAPLLDESLKDPDNPTKVFRVDFARVEHEFPLSRADLLALTPANLRTLSQEEIDQIYGRLTAGPIPDGPYQGDLFFARGDSLRPRLQEILGGIPGRLAGEKIELVERLGRTLWKGKMFDREGMVLRNFIEDVKPIEGLIDDPDSLLTAKVPRGGLLGRILPTTSVWLLFPAKLYCGQSLLDGRRESVIVDYLFGDEIEGYRPSPDSLAGRGGLRIRDEIRMVRPGFYLGRAYANRAFLLNFTLYNPEVAEAEADAFAAGEPIAEDCWPGEQQRQPGIQQAAVE